MRVSGWRGSLSSCMIATQWKLKSGWRSSIFVTTSVGFKPCHNSVLQQIMGADPPRCGPRGEKAQQVQLFPQETSSSDSMLGPPLPVGLGIFCQQKKVCGSLNNK